MAESEAKNWGSRGGMGRQSKSADELLGLGIEDGKWSTTTEESAMGRVSGFRFQRETERRSLSGKRYKERRKKGGYLGKK